MKKFLALSLCATLMLTAVSAHAFSTEQAPVTSDGTQKFADPDQQMPNFTASPDASSFANGLRPMPLQPGQEVTQPAMGDYDNGAAAFDQAYSHLQSR